ncbi:MAG TPA: hypothetical protein DC064_06595 [Cyanobacteria bacterium UBA9273]|nr:hypothetical protein [Cyanobacteria bacterium UBA9273]
MTPNEQQTTNNQPPTTNHQQQTTNNQPPTTNHQQPTTILTLANCSDNYPSGYRTEIPNPDPLN